MCHLLRRFYVDEQRIGFESIIGHEIVAQQLQRRLKVPGLISIRYLSAKCPVARIAPPCCTLSVSL